jgi:hypothetical protein
MILNRLFFETFTIIKYNLVLVQPLLFFILLTGVFTASLSKITALTPAAGVLVVSVFAMYCSFLAGWFNMFRKSIENFSKPPESKEEKAVYSINLFNEFFPGVGRHFTKIFLGFILFIVLFFIVVNIVGIIGEKFVGFPQNFTPSEIFSAMVNEQKAVEFVHKMTPEDKLIMTKWNLLTLIFTGILAYLTMFWAYAVVSADKSPFKAYLASLKIILKRPFSTFCIFILFWLSILFTGIFNGIAPNNIFIQFFGLILFVFMIIYFTMMNFLYFVQNSENNINSWTDSFR